jgi:hypothetical protein
MINKKKLEELYPEGSSGREAIKYLDVTDDELKTMDPAISSFASQQRDFANTLVSAHPEVNEPDVAPTIADTSFTSPVTSGQSNYSNRANVSGVPHVGGDNGFEAKAQQFRTLFTGMGVDPKQVEAMIEAKRSTYGQPSKSVRDQMAIMDYKKTLESSSDTSTGVPSVDMLDDATAVARIKNKYGPNVSLGNTQAERGARAKLLLAKEANGEKVDYVDLLSEKEYTKLNEATDSLSGVDRGLATLGKYGNKSQLGGTGAIIGNINEGTLPGAIFIGEKERDMRRAVTDVASAYQKFLSGVAVSAQEMVRLEGLLPSQKKPEDANIADMERLKKGMEINLELDKRAKLNKMTPDEAYKKFGQEVFTQFGEKFPESQNKGLDNIPNSLKVGKYSVEVQ